MGLAQQQHGHPGLADAAPHGQGQLTVEQHPVEGEGAAAVTACQGELAVQGLWADPDAHGGEFNSLAIDAVPEQNVAVQVPVIIVRGPAVMWLTRLQLSADPHEKHRTVLPDNGVLPLLGGELGI